MRHLALLSLALALSGCGYKTWSSLPFTSGGNPNAPAAAGENLSRVEGQSAAVTPMTTEPGDIWPGPLAPPPTLQDLEKSSGLTPQPEQPVPGSPLSRGTMPAPSPNPSTGSSTPPGNAQPNLATPEPAPPSSSYAAPPAAPPPRGQAGQVVQTPNGPEVTTGGTSGYQTSTSPGGGQSIIVPNGNGTSTVIHSDGRVETIPTKP
ncbi:MAG TPA: hypothetical protein VE690_06230 [Rhodopila sp.]|nr:hypothetical protein [Rhodopila sp.]